MYSDEEEDGAVQFEFCLMLGSCEYFVICLTVTAAWFLVNGVDKAAIVEIVKRCKYKCSAVYTKQPSSRLSNDLQTERRWQRKV